MMAVPSPNPAYKYPKATAAAFGRFFYASGSSVYYSQTLTSANAAGRCYQSNDPTSEVSPDILDTDGGVIPLEGAVGIKALLSFRSGVLAFADNGVWYVYGAEGGFKATSFNLSRITEQGLIAPKGVIAAEGSVFYTSSSGIVQIVANEFDNLSTQDVTEQTIREYYLENFRSSGVYASYDPLNKTVVFTKAGLPSKVLMFDLRAQAFYPQEVNSSRRVRLGLVAQNEHMYCTDQATGNLFEYTLSNTIDLSFNDFGTPSKAYLITGYETLGKYSNKKSITQCMAVFSKTETEVLGYEDNKYTYDYPSSCILQARWDFDSSNAFKKFVGVDTSGVGSGPTMQLYSPMQRGFIPTEFPWAFDTGESVISKRVKIRGNGKAVQLKFEAEDNKDLQLLGYSVQYSMRGRY